MEVSKIQIASFFMVSTIAIYGAYQWGKSKSLESTPQASPQTINKKEVIYLKEKTKIPEIEDNTSVINKAPSKIDEKKWLKFLQELKNTENVTQKKAEVLTEVIDEVQDQELDYYLEQFFEEDILVDINDKRLFSKRLLEEYSDSLGDDEIIDINGDIYFSTDSTPTQETKSNFSVKKNQNIFAHLVTKTSVADGKHVFIRWVRESDNQIILFERKRITLSSASNWVSIRPNEGWGIGAYSVTFYSFESQMQVIAKSKYYIDAIID